MNGEQEATSSDQAEPVAPATVTTFKCKTCGREFGKAQALATHEMRAHTRFWSTNQKPKAAPRQQRSAKNAQYLKYRDRYHAQGLNAKGRPYKRPGPGRVSSVECPVCHLTFKRRAYMAVHLRKVHGKSITEVNGIVSARGGRIGRPPGPENKSKTCPVCHKNFSQRPNMTLHLRQVHGRSITEFQGRGGGRLDAPAPAPTESPRPAPKPKPEGREIIFCPVCGTNIHAVRTAVNFAEQ